MPSGHNSKFSWNSNEAITKNEAENYFLDFMSTEILPKEKLPLSRKTVKEMYFSGNINSSSDALKKRVTVAYGDAYFGCPTMEYTKALFRSTPDTVTVFQWHFHSKPLGQIKFCPPWSGACHAEGKTKLQKLLNNGVLIVCILTRHSSDVWCAISFSAKLW